jgi:hypothetical protein
VLAGTFIKPLFLIMMMVRFHSHRKPTHRSGLERTSLNHFRKVPDSRGWISCHEGHRFLAEPELIEAGRTEFPGRHNDGRQSGEWTFGVAPR